MNAPLPTTIAARRATVQRDTMGWICSENPDHFRRQD